ncbi:MAG: sulfatase-like hydrolase/transferase [Brumimicrobium sp.]|nr:sulfatase-like hydrolase/transferase [Brumimicrobium sp.]
MKKTIPTYLLSALIVLILVWSSGFYLANSIHYIENPWEIWGVGVLNSLFAIGLISILFFPLHFLKTLSLPFKAFIHFILCSILLFELSSIFFFLITLTPIDSTVFEFNGEQIGIIYKSYFTVKWYYFLLPTPILLYFLFLRLLERPSKSWLIYFFLFIGGVSFFFQQQIRIDSGSYRGFSENKTIYFINSILNKDEINNDLTLDDIRLYQQTINHHLVNTDYPLYHPNDNKNTLAPFFNLGDTPPNIVYIIVESLSSSFSGLHADEISYTPFLDSLAKHSLYFENSLATAERSFASLPSVLGSLPHGPKGFMNTLAGYPANKTPISWFLQNGYTGNFYYGGYAHFDYMDLFIDNQGFKNIYDKSEYNYEGTGKTTSVDSIPFGIPDRALFQDIIEKEKHTQKSSPYIDVLITLSMHYPYIVENPNYYYEKVQASIQKSNAPSNIKKKHQKYIAEFATFLYTDDALKMYFKEREKLASHQNTIYVILGDHMFGDIPQTNPIEKYRSVLMIYSPLLNRTKNILGVNSHLDIGPSLYQLIQQKYKLPKLDSVSWLGNSLDTSATFQSKCDVAFMRNDRIIKDMLHNEYFYSEGDLYKISNRLHLSKVTNLDEITHYKNLLKSSDLIHKEVVTQNILIPRDIDYSLKKEQTRSLTIHEEKEFYNVLDDILKESYKELSFELNLVFSGDYAKLTPENAPNLVYTIKRGDSTIFWNTLEWLPKDMHQTNKKSIQFYIKNNLQLQLTKDDKILIYFWDNKRKVSNYNINATLKFSAL